MADMSQPPHPPCWHDLCQSVHSCSISQFVVTDGVGPVNLENVMKVYGLKHL